MNQFFKFAAAALLIGGSFAAQAQSGSDDAARRARNRDEAIAHHNGMPSGSSDTRSSYNPSRHDDSVRAKTHRTAVKTRGFTHRQLTKVRDFGARTDAKFPSKQGGVESGNKAPGAIGK